MDSGNLDYENMTEERWQKLMEQRDSYGNKAPKEIPPSTPESIAACRVALLAQLNSKKNAVQKPEDKPLR